MRVAVMAAGGVGGYFGARLASAGHDVTFFARGAHLAAIQSKGLRVESALGDLHIPNAKASDNPASVGPVDVVLFAVKLWDTEKAAAQLLPLIGPQTRVITLQNGIDSVERVAATIGAEHAVAGVAYIATVIGEPGVIKHTSQFAMVRCGFPDDRKDPALESFARAAQAAGIDLAIAESISVERWKKFVFLTGMAAVTGATRMSIGPILEDEDTRALFRQVMAEVIAVARARGVALPADFLDERMRFVTTVPKGMKASMLHDLERGNRLELDWLSGKVVQLGRELGVPTPANDAIYAVLKLHRTP